VDRIKRANFSVSTNSPDTRDGNIINDLCSFIPYKIVKLTCFVKRAKDRILRLNSRIPNCTMLAVRDTKCIISKDIQREGVINVN